jgi:hypothetical protein
MLPKGLVTSIRVRHHFSFDISITFINVRFCGHPTVSCLLEAKARTALQMELAAPLADLRVEYAHAFLMAAGAWSANTPTRRLSPRPEHDSLLSSCASVSTDNPSTSSACGPRITRRGAAGIVSATVSSGCRRT